MEFAFKLLKYLPRPLRRHLFILLALSTRAMTLGVRVVVQNSAGEILLVRHTYVKGWHFPGGGVERGETLVEAVRKELWEECRIKAGDKNEHFHTYKNGRTSRFDHVAVFRCHDWVQAEPKQPDGEIAETGFFPLDNLPAAIDRQTRVRLAELFENRPVSDIW